MEIRFIQENEIQLAVNTAHEAYTACVLPYVRSEEEVSQYNRYVNLENLWRGQKEGRLFLWGAFEGQEICGVCAMQSTGHITMLYVRPVYQRRGYGTALLEQMKGYAKEILQLEKVSVNVMPVMAAHFFYKRSFAMFGMPNPGASFVSLVADSKEMPSLRPKRNIPWKVIIGVIAGTLVLVFLVAVAYSVHYVVVGDSSTDADLEEFWENELGLPSDTEEALPEGDTEEAGSDNGSDANANNSEAVEEDNEYLAEWNIDDPENAVALPNNLGVAFIFPESEIYVGENVSYTIDPLNFTYTDQTDLMARDFNVNYPQLVFADGRDASTINDRIKSTACYYLDLMYPEVSSELNGDSTTETLYYTSYVNYEITYMDDNLISIAFMSNYCTGQSAFELSDVYSLVFNVQTGEIYHIEDVVSHDTEFDQAYYDKLCVRSSYLTEASGITTDTVSQTLDGTIVEDCYYSNYSLCKSGIKINFVYHYNQNGRLLYGWTDVNYTKDELSDYHTESEFWNLYTE